MGQERTSFRYSGCKYRGKCQRHVVRSAHGLSDRDRLVPPAHMLNSEDHPWRTGSMTEQQKYRVLETHGDVELRRYERCVVADAEVAGDADRAAMTAFGPLFRYISGANTTSSSLEMTAPVFQQARGEKLAMTAPVLQEGRGGVRWVVSFVLPGSRALADYPTPTDPRVSLREIGEETIAAVRWSGRWTSGNVAKHSRRLREAVARRGWTPTGDERWSRFDPPWKPPFARRNEILVPVSTGSTP